MKKILEFIKSKVIWLCAAVGAAAAYVAGAVSGVTF